MTAKIERIVAKKQRLEQLDLSRELRAADHLIARHELSRDLTQQIVHVDCDAFCGLMHAPTLSSTLLIGWDLRRGCRATGSS